MSVLAAVRVPATVLPIGEPLGTYPDVTIEVEPVVPTGSAILHLWVSGGRHEAYVAEVRDDPSVAAVQPTEDLPDSDLLSLDTDRVDAPLLRIIETIEASILTATGTHEGWSLHLRFPSQEVLGTFYDRCSAADIPVSLRHLQNGTPGDATDEYGMSSPQQEAIVAAFETGYFDVPRGGTIQDLADRLGISEQAVSERIRRGLANFLAATLARDRDRDTSETHRAK